jgi:hypothetical protein
MGKPSTINEPIDGEDFIAVVKPALMKCDAAALAHSVNVRWTTRQVCKLLKHPNLDIRRVAAVVLGMVGDEHTITCLTHALRDTDGQVNQMCEHALWSIWFRQGTPQSSAVFSQGISLLAEDELKLAIHAFRKAVEISPDFAEAWNQLGIAYYLNGQYKLSVKASQQAIKLIPTHFGAIAGMGHAFAQLDELTLALRCYRRAKRINPQMDGLKGAIDRLQTKIVDMSDSGYFEIDQMIA